MLVYRIVKTKYANDLSGEGASRFGGRWNQKLSPCIYTSESRALALLEFSVNVNHEEINKSLSIVTIQIPDRHIQRLVPSHLPSDWKSIPASNSTKDIGSNFLNQSAKSILQVPSSIIEDEFNFILNPMHPDAVHFKIIEVKEFDLDTRIKN